ncbi:hypothetical protein TeGR_g3030 [Tetraparma gracilis]|uniref:Uncharacterized protein n=1 Tax=Tetraparma gracilis TaxID=2962635 RepID=A0ABQ6N5E4_9STRA|nr:hypothetical protein TeGR_g3030 [Tetraparma gracilis]
MPSASFGALIRQTTITNSSPSPRTVEVLDGLAKLEPAGGPLDGQLKNMGRTLEGWMGVYQGDGEGTLTKPFYRLSTVPGDTASVKIQVEGHYCMAFEEGAGELLPVVFDTDAVFGRDTSLASAEHFEATPLEEILASKQSGAAKTSSAFAAGTFTLGPGESTTLISYYGKAPKIGDLDGYADEILSSPDYTSSKLAEMRAIMKELTATVSTTSASPLFNSHVSQMYLDNALRGGVPLLLGGAPADQPMRADADEDDSVKVYHTFSRIHGDLERDYNAYTIDATYFSQGQGNYRDVAQNRRNDVMFNPRMGAFNVRQFLSFIQADGYEPLTVQAVTFAVEDEKACADLAEFAVGSGDDFDTGRAREALTNILKGGQLRPGQLFQLMEDQDIPLQKTVSKQEFVDRFATVATQNFMAVYGDGFWADHWEYYLDLIDSYLSVYPDREEALMCKIEHDAMFLPPQGPNDPPPPPPKPVVLPPAKPEEAPGLSSRLEPHALQRFRLDPAAAVAPPPGEGSKEGAGSLGLSDSSGDESGVSALI